MSLDHINLKKIRKSFGKIPLVTNLPNLVEVQKRSYDNFLQLRTDPEKRENTTVKKKPNFLFEGSEGSEDFIIYFLSWKTINSNK